MPSQTDQDLYEQNQCLGHRINYLTDQNNFYRITINNIKKLNGNINKQLQSANHRISKGRNSQNVVDPRTVGDSYTAITNKIHLKNLQMKVGNMKRKVDKFQKVHAGSITSLLKQSQMLQKEVNVLGRQYQFYTIKNMLLDNLFLQDLLVSKLNMSELRHSSKQMPRMSNAYRPSPQIISLEETNLKTNNKLQTLLKSQKQLRQQKSQLSSKLSTLQCQQATLSSQISTPFQKNLNIRIAQAQHMQHLQTLITKQSELQLQINKQDILLEEQYKINQEYKQKILDRNQLEVKDIKGLQEKIKKREDQVRDIRGKCQMLENGRSKQFVKHK